jgi:acetyl-CoA carboxylase carboxyltransferase component
MGGAQAASTLLTVRLDAEKTKGRTMTPEEQSRFQAPILEKYEREGSPYYSTARLWDDGVIDPLDTRRVLALGLECAAYAPPRETRFGVFRM